MAARPPSKVENVYSNLRSSLAALTIDDQIDQTFVSTATKALRDLKSSSVLFWAGRDVSLLYVCYIYKCIAKQGFVVVHQTCLYGFGCVLFPGENPVRQRFTDGC